MKLRPTELVVGRNHLIVDIEHPQVWNILLKDIAHNLSHICRYNGSVPYPYSVAQHSLLVEAIVEDQGGTPEECLWALMHDAAEAYLGDLSTPLKAADRSGTYVRLEELWMTVIHKALLPMFPVDLSQGSVVSAADQLALQVEMSWFLNHSEIAVVEPRACELLLQISNHTPDTARREFLLRFRELMVSAREGAPTS